MFAALTRLVGAAAGDDKDFPFVVGNPSPVQISGSLWSLHEGTKKRSGFGSVLSSGGGGGIGGVSGSSLDVGGIGGISGGGGGGSGGGHGVVNDLAVSVFVVDAKTASASQLAAARNCARRLRTLRHPGVLKFLGSSDTEARICIATERVTPLLTYLRDEDNTMARAWGMHQVASALVFLSDAGMIHGNICADAVFVNAQGDWKLGGVEYLAPAGEFYGNTEIISSIPTRYVPPEGNNNNIDNGKNGHAWSRDVWGLGCLLWEAHNGALSRPEQLKDTGSMSRKVAAQYARLVSANPRSRPSPAQFVERARGRGGFMDNAFVDAMLFLDEMAVQEAEKKADFFRVLPDQLDKFPRAACINRILPQLLQAFQYGGAGYQVLVPMLKIGQLLEPDEFTLRIVPSLVKLFSSPDRATRISLLQRLPEFIDFLSESVVEGDIFPQVATGFSDTVPAVREATVKSMVHLAPKLGAVAIDGVLLKHFARLQTDENAGIRANTTTCLGMIASHLPPAAQNRVLLPAFLRATRDPFKHSRKAAVSSLRATLEVYGAEDLARKLVPGVAGLLIDAEIDVRNEAFALLEEAITCLRKVSEKQRAVGGSDGSGGVDSGILSAAASETHSGGASNSKGGKWSSWAGSAVSGLAAAGAVAVSAVSNTTKGTTLTANTNNGIKSSHNNNSSRSSSTSFGATTSNNTRGSTTPARAGASESRMRLNEEALDGWGEQGTGGDGWDSNAAASEEEEEEWGDIEGDSGSAAAAAADGDGWGNGGVDGWGDGADIGNDDGLVVDAKSESEAKAQQAKREREAARAARKAEREARTAERNKAGRKPMKLGRGGGGTAGLKGIKKSD